MYENKYIISILNTFRNFKLNFAQISKNLLLFNDWNIFILNNVILLFVIMISISILT